MRGMSLDRFYFPLGEVVARLLQWGLPLALGVLVVGEGLAGALIYLSLHSIDDTATKDSQNVPAYHHQSH